MQCPKCEEGINESIIKVQPCPCIDGIEVGFSCPGCGREFFCLLSTNTFLQDLGKPSAVEVPDEAVTVSILSLVDITVDEAIVAGWSGGQRLKAIDWASAVHFRDTGNYGDAEVPEMPGFLRPYQGNPFEEVT